MKGRIPFGAACVGALVLVVATGCDHRISLDEFLKMQQQASPPPTTQPATTTKITKADIDKRLGPYTVGPEDVLAITVIGAGGEAAGATIQARVRHDGTIELPLAGVVKVEGLELEDVEKAVKKQYEADVYKSATVHVEVDKPHVYEVLVTGAVTSPGLSQLRRNERNLLYAIVRAGGTSTAASGRVTLCRIRDRDKKTTLDLRDAEAVTKALTLPPLEDGDMITVEAATPNTVFVGGLVNGPAPQAYPPGVPVTVLQALAAAGGLRTDVLPREATLIRRMPDGKDVHVKLNLDRLGTGKDPNIQLAAGDILWVPHTIETRIEEWVSRNIYLTGGVDAAVRYNFIHTEDIRTGKEGGGGGTSILIGQ